MAGLQGWPLFFWAAARGNPFPEVKVFSLGSGSLAHYAILTLPLLALLYEWVATRYVTENKRVSAKLNVFPQS